MMKLFRWVLVHIPTLRGLPIQSHHIHEQTGDDNKDDDDDDSDDDEDDDGAYWRWGFA